MEAPIEVEVTGVAAGGEGVGRLPDGRAVFVRAAIPGDRVAVGLTQDKRRFARGAVLEVLAAGPDRVEPPCALVAAGCGGCDWQHVAPTAQRRLKATIVADALQRIGRLPVDAIPEIDPGVELASYGYRTTVRVGVLDGRAAFHPHHRGDLLAIGEGGCLVAHPLVDEVLRDGRFGTAAEVTVRAGVATGERLALVAPRVPIDGDDDELAVPEGVAVVGADELEGGHRAWIHEDVGGRRWRISADSFFQGRPDGAAAMAEAVASAVLAGPLPAADAPVRLVDLYGGVGLLGGIVADRLVAAGHAPPTLQVVEANRSSLADARHNLADLPGHRIVGADVRRWRPSVASVVVADPSRHGLGAEAVAPIVGTEAPSVVLVSCDPGALGRDAGLLAAAGYRLASVELVDLFPQTAHVEVVSAWRLPG